MMTVNKNIKSHINSAENRAVQELIKIAEDSILKPT
jgi:hypothetical protein